jgi:ABC-type polysaccharide/polyol phosphate transport system ATPase subunit
MLDQIGDRPQDVPTADEPPSVAIEIASVSKWGGAVEQLERRFVRNEALQLLIELAILTRNVKGRRKGRLGARQLTPLLKNINLTIERGSVVGVVDAGGASRNALLRILANCDVPSRGEVRLFGKMAAFQHLAAARLAYHSCRKNMEFDARLVGLPRRDVLSALDRVPQFSGDASKYIDMPVRRLSSRMVGELGLSLLCCLDYDILVVDEIAYPQSPEILSNWRIYLQRAPERGKTVIASSRHLSRLHEYCTHLLLIKDAELLDYGPKQELAERHAEFLALSDSTPTLDVPKHTAIDDDEYGELP